jgi:L-ascorbate metabolism protein UlaG (beta-lactamase superfamily)
MSDHFDGRRFFNRDGSGARPLGAVLRWMLTRRPARWPKHVVDPGPPALPPAPNGGLAATFVGHSTFLVRLPEAVVLTDPIWSERASPLSWAGPRRVRRPGLAWEQLPPVDLVLLSHNHYDHLDLPTLHRLRDTTNPLIVTCLGLGTYLARRGFQRVVELDWWQDCRHADLQVTLTPARHASGRGLFDRNRTLWGGFVVRSTAGVVFYAGDTGYGQHFADVRRRLGPPDLALLPIGAYEPRWFMAPVHMNPAEALRAFLDLEPRLAIAMHFGTFQLTDEPIDEPVRALRQALAENGVDEARFRVLGCGETVTLTPSGR